MTELLIKASSCNHPTLVWALLENHGASSRSNIALYLTVLRGHFRVAQILLDHGANPDQSFSLVEGDGLVRVPVMVALGQAFLSNRPAIAYLLMMRGANPDVQLEAACPSPRVMAAEQGLTWVIEGALEARDKAVELMRLRGHLVETGQWGLPSELIDLIFKVALSFLFSAR